MTRTQNAGWDAALEYVDHGVSGSKDRRPALDRLVKNARRASSLNSSARCELAGALLMANALLCIVRGMDVPKYLVSALVNGKLATTGFPRVSGLTPEDHRQSLRGLAFIGLGFVLKVAVIVWKIAADVNTLRG